MARCHKHWGVTIGFKHVTWTSVYDYSASLENLVKALLGAQKMEKVHAF